MCGRVLEVTIEYSNIVYCAGYDHCHDSNPHAVDDVALHRAVDEYTVADEFVVVEVAADDGRAEVNDDTGDVDDGDAEQHAADACASLDAHRYVTAHTHTHTLAR